MAAPDPRALVVDASEWFHDPAWAAHVPRRHWRRLPARADVALAAALQACERHHVRATFCVDAATAARWPELLRRVVAAGHDVASAGHEPIDLDTVAPAARPAVLAGFARAREALEAVTGRAVRTFRAPWPARGDPWWREALRAAGYAAEVLACGRVLPLDAAHRGDLPSHAEVLVAWELDRDQPRLLGLPARVRHRHEARLVGAAARWERCLAAGPWAAPAGPGDSDPVAGAVVRPAAPTAAAANAANAAPSPAPARSAAAPRLAVVVPLKDEADGVPSLLQELDALAADLADRAALEFVFVDDGSTDATAALLAAAVRTRPHAQLVRHDRNRGVAAAIRTGLAATDAETAASIDADLSYDPRELAAMLPLLAHADVVTASPYHPRGGVHNVPGWRLFLSRTLSRCYRWLLRSDLHTWTACFRVYRRAAVVDLPQAYPGFLGTAELLVRLLRRGGRVAEHPCLLEARLFGVSKLRVLRTVRDHLGLLWQVARRRIS
ncbi:MAG: glycosyltransferase [Planctomycetes bacterium]|nr:glycosyltransferase [Planctomycetota bacterium]